MNYSTERIVSKFEQLSGRKPSLEEINKINSANKTLTTSICELLNIQKPNVMYTAGAHCKSDCKFIM